MKNHDEGIKGILIGLSLTTLLLGFSMPMRVFMHYITLAEFYVKTNPEFFYPISGVIWVLTLYWVISKYWAERPKPDRFWVVDESVLNEYNGFHKGPEAPKPVLVKEIKDALNHG